MHEDNAPCEGHDQIHVLDSWMRRRPAGTPSLPGVVVHRGPPLHPDDVTTLNGIPVTSPSRTLIDCAEFMTVNELRAAFARAREQGLLDRGGTSRGSSAGRVASDPRDGR